MVLNPPSTLIMGAGHQMGKLDPGRQDLHRDELKDFRVEAPDFHGSLKPKDHLELVQSMKRIIKIKE